jgi:predicted ribosomally synthesized peptide with SipW-like signal peptide
MKKILISLLSVLAVTGLIGSGYLAYFQDTEASSNNTFTAGILDLEVDCEGDTIFAAQDSPLPKIFEYLPVGNPLAPGDSGEVTISLHMKADSIKADLWMEVTSLADNTGLTPEPELAGDDVISDDIQVKLWQDDDQNRIQNGSEKLVFQGTLLGLASRGKTPVDYNVGPDSPRYLGWSWELPITVGNKSQGDTCTFDIIFGADQATTYALVTSVVGNGTIGRSPPGSDYAPETPVMLTAIPAIGHRFTGWTGDIVGLGNPGYLIMHGPKSVTASFVPIEYVLTVNVIGSGSVVKSPDKTTYHYGDVVQLTANPGGSGWLFDSWTGGLTGSTSPATITIAGDLSITSKFVTPILPPTGMVSWWTGDGTANDFYNINNGTLGGGATYTAGKVGQAFSFDGIDDSVFVSSSGSLDLGNTHTVDMWVKLSAYPSDPYSYLLLNKWASGQEDKTVGIRSDGKAYYYLHYVMGGAGLFSNTTLALNTWYHIAATYDGSTARLYINGQLDNSKSAGGDIGDSGGTLYLGHNPLRSGYGVPFKGQMDEIEWFNRTLSQAEIQSIYNAGVAGKVKVWSLPRQYSSTQGVNNWYYYGHPRGTTITAANFAPLTFDNWVDPWGTRPFYDWNNNASRYMEFVGRDLNNWLNIGTGGASGWLQPGEYGNNNIAIGWRAPRSGTVYISGMLNTTSPDATAGGWSDNGVYFSIYKGATLLTGPSLVFRGNNEGNRTASVTFTPTTSVNAGDFIYFYIDRGDWQDADGMYYNFTVSYDPNDDLTPPSSTHSQIGTQLTLSATDTRSGVARIEYLRYSSPTTDWIQYTGPFTVATGQKYMYRALDNNGNIEAYRRVTIP